MEFTCRDHSPRTLVVTFNRSQVNIGRASTQRSLYYCLFVLHICMVLFFTHIPFVVNHTINATPPERLQQWHTTKQYQTFSDIAGSVKPSDGSRGEVGQLPSKRMWRFLQWLPIDLLYICPLCCLTKQKHR